MDMAFGIVLVAPHAHSFRAKRDAFGVESDALFMEEMGIDILAVF